MINHARTLLMNVDGSPSGFAGEVGEEYIPPLYRKLKLTGPLQSVYRVLYGSNPDRVFLNYRTRQLMSLIHNTDLADYVTAMDPRITYDTGPLDDLFYNLFQIQVVPEIGLTKRLFLVGDLQPDVVQGRCYAQWRVEVLTSSTVNVRRQTPPVQEIVYDYTTTEGLSSLIPLPGSTLQFRIEPQNGAVWRVQGYARPAPNLTVLEAGLRRLGEPIIVQLFQVATPAGKVEPYPTFRNCWERHPLFAYRLAGLLMAYLYRVESLRSV